MKISSLLFIIQIRDYAHFPVGGITKEDMIMSVAQYAKVTVTGQVGTRRISKNYAVLLRTGETYHNALLRLSTAAVNRFMRDYDTGGRRPSFREIPGGPFNSTGGAILL